MILRTDIYEHNGHLIVAIEVPGVEQEMLDVRIERYVLTIECQRPPVRTPSRDYHRRERPSGPFRRDIALPVCVGDRANEFTDTRLLDGVFTLRIPIDTPMSA